MPYTGCLVVLQEATLFSRFVWAEQVCHMWDSASEGYTASLVNGSYVDCADTSYVPRSQSRMYPRTMMYGRASIPAQATRSVRVRLYGFIPIFKCEGLTVCSGWANGEACRVQPNLVSAERAAQIVYCDAYRQLWAEGKVTPHCSDL